MTMSGLWLMAVMAADIGDVNPQFLKDWIIVLCAVLGMLLLVLNIVEKFKGKKVTQAEVQVIEQPLRVALQTEFVPRQEFTDRLTRIDNDLIGLRKDNKEDQMELKKLLTALGEKIDKTFNESFHRLNEADKEIAELKGTVEVIKAPGAKRTPR